MKTFRLEGGHSTLRASLVFQLRLVTIKQWWKLCIYNMVIKQNKLRVKPSFKSFIARQATGLPNMKTLQWHEPCSWHMLLQGIDTRMILIVYALILLHKKLILMKTTWFWV